MSAGFDRSISPGEAAISELDSTPGLAVVIINFDSGDHLRNCIANLPAAMKGVNGKLIVVDNASSDGSLDGIGQQYPEVTVIRNSVNKGYGRACNQGFAATGAPLVCFLNPDIVPHAGSLAQMVEAIAARPGVGVLGPRLNNPDGSRYPSCRVVPSLGVAIGHATLGLLTSNNRFTRAYQLSDLNHDEEREVDWVSGAAMLTRREAFQQVNGFDEGFFMYVEDVDLCARLREAGWKALYYPQAQMLHHVAGSSRRTPYRMIRHHHFSLMRYAYRRTKGPARVLLPLIAAGLAVRMVLVWVDLFIRMRTGKSR
ncbi:MAG TPA: glycosyltransferase family 2 protein [Actinomycetota bacterium]|nr:glycosyltransferase family 2 protein [Actinomycetota bacterium]